MTMITPDFGVVPTSDASREVADPVTELLRHHARELIAAAAGDAPDSFGDGMNDSARPLSQS